MLFWLFKHGNCDRGSLHASAFLCWANTLPSMTACLVSEDLGCFLTTNLKAYESATLF